MKSLGRTEMRAHFVTKEYCVEIDSNAPSSIPFFQIFHIFLVSCWRNRIYLSFQLVYLPMDVKSFALDRKRSVVCLKSKERERDAETTARKRLKKEMNFILRWGSLKERILTIFPSFFSFHPHHSRDFVPLFTLSYHHRSLPYSSSPSYFFYSSIFSHFYTSGKSAKFIATPRDSSH